MNVRIYEIDPDAGSLQSKIITAPGAVQAQQVNVERVRDGTWTRLRALRDGAPITVPWKQALIFEGVCFHITVGEFSTGVAGGGATTVLDLDQPRFTVALPTAATPLTLLPIDVRIQLLSGTVDADNNEYEALVAADRTQAIIDGTATAETIFNARTDSPRPSGATARSTYTGNSTAPVLGLELARNAIIADVQTAVGVHTKLVDLIYVPDATPLLFAPCTLLGYFGGDTTTTGYAQVMWAELPAGAFL